MGVLLIVIVRLAPNGLIGALVAGLTALMEAVLTPTRATTEETRGAT
jgi:hypothetical protein